jgi:hypothetical protein
MVFISLNETEGKGRKRKEKRKHRSSGKTCIAGHMGDVSPGFYRFIPASTDNSLPLPASAGFALKVPPDSITADTESSPEPGIRENFNPDRIEILPLQGMMKIFHEGCLVVTAKSALTR